MTHPRKTALSPQYFCLALLLALISLVACGGGPGGASVGGGGTGGTGGGDGGGTGSGVFTGGRTKYVRTDATTEYFLLLNDHWIIYNPLTNYFYVTDPGSNHVFVLSASSQTQVGKISVPGAYSLDDTPDHKTLYVATVIGDVYTIDPVALTVMNRYLSSQIGPSGFPSGTALAMADGRIALLGGTGGVSVDGAGQIALWNPANNALSTVGICSGFIGNNGGISRTPDRTRIILSNVDGGAFCIIDESTGLGKTFGPGAFPSVNFRISPDGNYLAVPYNTETLPPNTYAQIYDLSTLALVNQFVVTGDTATDSGFAFSSDSKTLFVPNEWIIYAYDLASGQQVGWLPNINVPFTSGGLSYGPETNPNLQAADNTGLLAGPLEEGVGFIDTTVMRTGPIGTQFTNGYAVPGTGPPSGGTQLSITEPVTFGSLSGVYFGSQGSTDISGVNGPNTYGNFGSVSATAPPGPAGPTDIYVTTADGGMQVLPEGFSYGPTIIEVTPNMSTGEGGGIGVIYGYGFGPVGTGVEEGLPSVAHGAASTDNGIPSSLQVTVGGTPVPVTGFLPYAYDSQSPPFPLQALSYTVPGGASSASLTVTSSSGSATANSGLIYLPAIQQFSLPGASLAQGIYDPYTNLYYFTDANKVQVFSRAQGAWQTPITIPAPQGASQRLWGIALSPNGGMMAVADTMAGVIYTFDPSNPTVVNTFSTGAEPYGETLPCGVAISDGGMVYYTTVGQGIGGADEFFRLDTSTGNLTDYEIEGPDYNGNAQLRAIISADNSRVFFNDDGFVFYVDTATDQWTPASFDEDCCYGDYDLALSAGQTQFEASSYLYDFNLDAESYYALNDREVLGISYVYGAKLSPDGRLLFQPSTTGIDVLDGRLGNLLNRIALSVPLSENYDALVSDGTDNVLIAITGTGGNGIAVLDLNSVPEPAALRYPSKASHGNSFSSSNRARGASKSLPHRNIHRLVPHIANSLFRQSRSEDTSVD
jgi:hypothetical protein